MECSKYSIANAVRWVKLNFSKVDSKCQQYALLHLKLRTIYLRCFSVGVKIFKYIRKIVCKVIHCRNLISKLRQQLCGHDVKNCSFSFEGSYLSSTLACLFCFNGRVRHSQLVRLRVGPAPGPPRLLGIRRLLGLQQLGSPGAGVTWLHQLSHFTAERYQARRDRRRGGNDSRYDWGRW